MTPKKPNPDDVLAELKAKLGRRAHANLVNVHEVCRAISNLPGDPTKKDYSLATVGRKLEQLKKSPGYNTLKSPGGRHFKTLIRAWADYHGAGMVKHTAPSAPVIKDEELLRKIPEPALRSEIGFRLAEGRRYRAELATLKGQTTLTIDMRPKDGLPYAQGGSLQLLDQPPPLLESERETLTSSIHAGHLKRLGIVVGEDGELLLQGKVLFGVGFVSGLQKLLQLSK